MTTRTMDELAAALYGNATTQTTTITAPKPSTAPSNRTEAELAEALYGSNGSARQAPTAEPLSSPTDPKVSEPRQRNAEELGAALYGNDQPLPKADEPEDEDMHAIRQSTARRLYGTAAIEKAIPESEFDSQIGTTVSGVKLTREMTQKVVVELREMAADLSLSRNEVQVFRDSFRRDSEVKGDPERVTANRETAVEVLNNEHGNEANLALRAARAYVAKNTKLAAMLDRTGAGDDPNVVALIARKALQLHKAGNLSLTVKPRRR